MQIILQFHEALSGVVACQAKMQFDIVRGKNVTWCKYPFVHIVAHLSVQHIPNYLLRVLGQCNKVGILLVAVRPHNHVQSFLVQAVRGCRIKEALTIIIVSYLFYGQILPVYDEGEQCESLAQGKAGVEQFSSIVVFGLGWHTRCQVQVAHSYHTVAEDHKSLAVFLFLFCWCRGNILTLIIWFTLRFITSSVCIRCNAFFPEKEHRLSVSINIWKRRLSPHSSFSMGNCLNIQLRRFGIVFEQNIRIADTSKNTQNISSSEKKIIMSQQQT